MSLPASLQLYPVPPTVEEYRQLRVLAGLSPKSLEAATLGLPNTVFGVSIRDGERLVAMGRLVGDRGCFLQVVDIAVVPDRQGQGLGKAVMGALDVWLRANAVGAYVSLIADGQAHRLYAQFGFAQTAPKSVGMAKVVG
ncbi:MULTISPECIES: GNAT family N-acetyltransferase [Stenotrophomonas]|jgi:GNAT superfamily N-acetyltransferase|uniref:GNAT family N-acetyltransferase n=1 Tax=Stenotrophomonas TaxID=40323 RepID=UPI000308A386|nr:MULTISPECIES: GNAT family N-acetyltransferase [Stenotrophomonas]MBD3828740.1 GNAT family N-acetyltransferase [Stenotrophomonas sp.]QIO88466.1 AttT protein [Stenotrophomonas rhizophila]HBS62040.1 N-acetyltransferase [Stenotrophomonas sp.]